VDELWGNQCPGYPIQPDYKIFGPTGYVYANTSLQNSGPQFQCTDPSKDECYKLYFPLYFIMPTLDISFGISCYDTKNKQLCPSEEFIRLGPNVYNYKLPSLFFGVGYDPSSASLNLIRHGTRLYTFSEETQILSYDLATKAICVGYAIVLFVHDISKFSFFFFDRRLCCLLFFYY
jgi:hypothetical protein